jgi:hypothetical protein
LALVTNGHFIRGRRSTRYREFLGKNIYIHGKCHRKESESGGRDVDVGDEDTDDDNGAREKQEDKFRRCDQKGPRLIQGLSGIWVHTHKLEFKVPGRVESK